MTDKDRLFEVLKSFEGIIFKSTSGPAENVIILFNAEGDSIIFQFDKNGKFEKIV